MAQTFRYPNLLDVSAGHAVLAAGRIGDIPSVVCHGDPVVGDYYRVIPEQDLTSWSFVNITDVSAAGDVPVGTRMAISLLMRVGGEPYHAYPNLLLGQGIDGLLGSIAYSHEDVGGGWSMCITTGVRTSMAYKGQIFYAATSSLKPKAGTTIDFAQPMVCVADEPHAWAPAAGEVWP